MAPIPAAAMGDSRPQTSHRACCHNGAVFNSLLGAPAATPVAAMSEIVNTGTCVGVGAAAIPRLAYAKAQQSAQR
jgi:hypothetical protein